MFKKIVLPATLAVSILAGLAPAYATMTLPHQTPPPPATATEATMAPSDEATLSQLAMEAGITVDQARHLTISQLAALKEAHDS